MSNTMVIDQYQLGKDTEELTIFDYKNRNFFVLTKGKNLVVMSGKKTVLEYRSPDGRIKSAIFVRPSYLVLGINNYIKILDIGQGWSELPTISFGGFIRVWSYKNSEFFVSELNKLYVLSINNGAVRSVGPIDFSSPITSICYADNKIFVFTLDTFLHVLDKKFKATNKKRLGISIRKVAKINDSTLALITHNSIYLMNTKTLTLTKVFHVKIRDISTFDIDGDGRQEILFVDGEQLGLIAPDRIINIDRAPGSRLIRLGDHDRDGVIEFYVLDDSGNLRLLKPTSYYAYLIAVSNGRYDTAMQILANNRSLFEKLLKENKIHRPVMTYLYANGFKVSLRQALDGINQIHQGDILRKFFERAFRENKRLLLDKIETLGSAQLLHLFKVKPELIPNYYSKIKEKLSDPDRIKILKLALMLPAKIKRKFLGSLPLDDIIDIWDSLTRRDLEVLNRESWEKILDKRPELAVDSPFLEVRIQALLKLGKYESAYGLIKNNKRVWKAIEPKAPNDFLVYLLKKGFMVSDLDRVFPLIRGDPDVLMFIARKDPAYIKRRLAEVGISESDLVRLINTVASKIELTLEDVSKLPKKDIIVMTSIAPNKKFLLLYPYLNSLSNEALYELWRSIGDTLRKQINPKTLLRTARTLKKKDLFEWLIVNYTDLILTNRRLIPPEYLEDLLITLVKRKKIGAIEKHIDPREVSQYKHLFDAIVTADPRYLVRNAKKLDLPTLSKYIDKVETNIARSILAQFEPKEALKIVLNATDESAFNDENIIKPRAKLWQVIPPSFYDSLVKIAPKFVLHSGIPPKYRFSAGIRLRDFGSCARIIEETINQDPENLRDIIAILGDFTLEQVLRVIHSVSPEYEEEFINMLAISEPKIKTAIIRRYLEQIETYHVLPLEQRIISLSLLVPNDLEIETVKATPKNLDQFTFRGITIYSGNKEIYVEAYDPYDIQLTKRILRIKINQKIRSLESRNTTIIVKHKKGRTRLELMLMPVPSIKSSALIIDAVGDILDRREDMLEFFLQFGGGVTMKTLEWVINKLRREPDWSKQFIKIIQRRTYPWDAKRIVEAYKKAKKNKTEALIRSLESYIY